MAQDDGVRGSNIRDVIGYLVGQRIIEITQQDDDEFVPGGPSQVLFHMEDGTTVRFWIDDAGFDILDAEGDDNDARE